MKVWTNKKYKSLRIVVREEYTNGKILIALEDKSKDPQPTYISVTTADMLKDNGWRVGGAN